MGKGVCNRKRLQRASDAATKIGIKDENENRAESVLREKQKIPNFVRIVGRDFSPALSEKQAKGSLCF